MELFDYLFPLRGKNALITGGYKGIGLIFAETYAEAGATVVLAARSLEQLQRTAGNITGKYGVKAIAKSMDIKKSGQVDAVVEEVVAEFGKIDILVNNAGISGSEKPVLSMTDKDLDEVMDINFRGTFMVSRAVASEMVKKESGKIINIASIAAKQAISNMSGYCASKAAIVQLTRVMAMELMRYNIQVNALCPGYFLTDLNREFFTSEPGKRMVGKKIPIKRLGKLEELKSTAVYLATCPAFMTGADLYIDGGHTIG